MRSFILISSLLIFSTLLFESCSDSNAAPETSSPAPRIVKTATVKTLNYQETVKASGQLALAEESRLGFKTGGIISKIYVREGQEVRKGQLLAEIEIDEISARAQQAELGQAQSEISVENAKLALRLAERDLRNAKGLYQDSVATLEQLENAEVQLDNARNQLKLAERAQSIQTQQLEVADYNLRHAKIFAPSSGTILRKLAEPNEIVGPGTPAILFGSREKALVMRVSITDKDVVHLSLGDTAKVMFDALPGTVFQGTVREIAGMADPYTGTFEVEIGIAAKGSNLRSGFIGQVELTSSNKQQLLSIPVDALKVADGSTGEVYTFNGQTVHKKQVEIYKIEGDQLLLKTGLNTNQQVITTGLGFLQDGMTVTAE